MFSGDSEREQREKMGLITRLKSSYSYRFSRMYPPKNTCSNSTIKGLQKGFNDVVLVFLLLTLNKFHKVF